MPESPRLNSIEAEKLLLENGFELIRTKGSHRIFKKLSRRVVIPFQGKDTLHPKIVKDVLDAIQEN